MSKRQEKQLTVNSVSLIAFQEDGEWWLAVKPLCAALKVDYKQQQKNISTDPILSRASCVRTTHDTTNRRQEMLCLPERYVYGWLFGLRSESTALAKYKQVCYDVLFDYFHGNSGKRAQVLVKIKVLDAEIFKVQESLKTNAEFIHLKDLKLQKGELERQLNQLDEDMIDNQLDLFTDKPLLQ
jgi:hypothetical protein